MWQKPRNVTKFEIVTLWHLEITQNVTKCHTFPNFWYKATFTFYVWIRLGTALGTGFAAESGQIRKIRHFQTFEVWTFVPAIFWFLVVRRVKMWSDRKKSSKKDSWYQDYSVLLTSAPPSCHRQPSAFVPKISWNIWKQAEYILVERTINQNIEVLLFW